MSVDLLPDVARATLTCFMILAGIAKLFTREAFLRTLSDLGLGNRGVRRTVATLVPLIEVTLGLLVLSPWVPKLAVAGLALLLVAFTGILALNLAQGRAFSCQCFGPLSESLSSWRDVGRNGILIALCLVYLGFGNERAVAGILPLSLGVGGTTFAFMIKHSRRLLTR